ncbi:MAG: YunC family protein [Pirellula sp.]|nr:YunC family protein [Pirellula sp.]
MSVQQLVSRNEILKLPFGECLGSSFQWPGGQYCAIHTDRGMVGCGIYDCHIASQFGYAVAIARGTPSHPLREPEDLLNALIVELSGAATSMGIQKGMTGLQALAIMCQDPFPRG